MTRKRPKELKKGHQKQVLLNTDMIHRNQVKFLVPQFAYEHPIKLQDVKWKRIGVHNIHYLYICVVDSLFIVVSTVCGVLC